MYYVLHYALPNDCMETHVKIVQFESIAPAINYYRNYFYNCYLALNDLKEVFLWDDDAINEAHENDYSIVVYGEIYLLKTNLLLDNVANLTWLDDPIQYGVWFSEFEGLAYNQNSTTVLEFIENLNIEILCSYPFELTITEDCLQACARACAAGQKSLEKIMKEELD